MPWRICRPYSETKFICFRIPMPWEIPQPLPKWAMDGSTIAAPTDPSPWLGGDVSIKVGVQLSAFAAIDVLADALGEQQRGAIQKIVRNGAGELVSDAIRGSKLEYK